MSTGHLCDCKATPLMALNFLYPCHFCFVLKTGLHSAAQTVLIQVSVLLLHSPRASFKGVGHNACLVHPLRLVCFNSQEQNFFLDYRWPYCPLVFSLCLIPKDLDYRAYIYIYTVTSCPCMKMQCLQSTVQTGRVSLFLGLPFLVHPHSGIFFFFNLCSAHILPILYSLGFCPVSDPALFAWEKHKLGYHQFAFYK